ncbi:MAG: hypothetical protein QG633_623 [Patescibacteria group bacterium]|nr:hypothetical protein [Patescibacteria group bacterium]
MKTPNGMLGVLRSGGCGLSRRLLRAAGVGPIGIDPLEHALPGGRNGVGFLHLLQAGGAGQGVDHEAQVPLVPFHRGKKLSLLLTLCDGFAVIRVGLGAIRKLAEEQLFGTVGHIVSL